MSRDSVVRDVGLLLENEGRKVKLGRRIKKKEDSQISKTEMKKGRRTKVFRSICLEW